jgi:chemotaxis protein MotA
MTKFDFSTLLGISIAIALLIVSISLSTDLAKYINFPAALIVFGSTLAISCASYSFRDVWNVFKTMIEIVVVSPANSSQIAILAIQSAEYAYKNGLHDILKKPEFPIQQKFFRKWMSFILDGEKLPSIDNLINQEIYTFQEQQGIVVQILKRGAELAPAYGLIGTIVGLVQMLGGIQDITSIGQGLAVALLTTFYGALLAYMFLVPMASKLERNLKDEILNFRILHRTILSIAQKENPRQLESVLNSILPPGKKVAYYKY